MQSWMPGLKTETFTAIKPSPQRRKGAKGTQRRARLHGKNNRGLASTCGDFIQLKSSFLFSFACFSLRLCVFAVKI
jgi:hypothetical protein